MITIGTTVGGALIAGFIAWYGDYLPKPILEPDLAPVYDRLSETEERLAANEQLTREQALYVTEARLADFMRARDQHIQEREPVPQYIQEQIRRLERQVRSLERELGVD